MERERRLTCAPTRTPSPQPGFDLVAGGGVHSNVCPAGWWVPRSELEPGRWQIGTCRSQVCGLAANCLRVASPSSEHGWGSVASRLGWAGLVCLLKTSSLVQLVGCQLLLDSATGELPRA